MNRIETPCRRVCRPGPDRVCDGCGRTLEEIGEWVYLTPAERREVMDRVAGWAIRPERETPVPTPPRPPTAA